MGLSKLPAWVLEAVVPDDVACSPDGEYKIRAMHAVLVSRAMIGLAGAVVMKDQFSGIRVAPDRERSVLRELASEIFQQDQPYTTGRALVALEAWEFRDRAADAKIASLNSLSHWYAEFRKIVPDETSKKRLALAGRVRALLDELASRLAPIFELAPQRKNDRTRYLLPMVVYAEGRALILQSCVRSPDRWLLTFHDWTRWGTVCFKRKRLGGNLDQSFPLDFGRPLRQAEPMMKSLLVEDYPALTNLAEWIVTHTESATQRKLWLTRRKSILSRLGMTGALRERGTHVDLTELVLMDCIERSPVEVLLSVASLESGELEGYIRELAGEAEGERIVAQLVRSEGGWSAGLQAGLSGVRGRRLAMKVLELLNFQTCDPDALLGIESLRRLLFHLQQEVVRSQSAEAFRGLIQTFFADVAERVFREMVLFYEAILHGPDLDSDQWEVRRTTIGLGGGLGTWIGRFRDLNRSEPLARALTERCGFSGPLMSDSVLREILHTSSGEPLGAVRNWLSHEADGREKVDWDASARFDAVFMKGLCSRVLDAGERMLEALAPEASERGEEDVLRRIFPFKLSFVLYERHYIGFSRFNYVTESIPDPERRGTFIYTHQQTEFGRVYYALPHRHKVGRRLWMDPVLIDARYL